MKWPWHKEPHRDWEAVDETGGRQARERAERDLEATRAQTPGFRELARELHEIRQTNHLADAFMRAAGGRR